ncbi:MAG: helix-turn-helix transcriptional regulator [Clostridia bacterium]|nr:helix-turn-helix transcriptional regulator [Clostridia bacterium]
MNGFRERLEDLLIEHNMSKNQLSKIVGVRPDTIYGYYRRNLLPEIHIAKRIANYFKCSLDYLFGLSEQINNNDINDLSFADTIKKLIKENNKSVEKTMKELNISDRTYYRWQSGESKPLTSIIVTLAKYFDVSVDYIIGNLTK